MSRREYLVSKGLREISKANDYDGPRYIGPAAGFALGGVPGAAIGGAIDSPKGDRGRRAAYAGGGAALGTVPGIGLATIRRHPAGIPVMLAGGMVGSGIGAHYAGKRKKVKKGLPSKLRPWRGMYVGDGGGAYGDLRRQAREQGKRSARAKAEAQKLKDEYWHKSGFSYEDLDTRRRIELKDQTATKLSGRGVEARNASRAVLTPVPQKSRPNLP